MKNTIELAIENLEKTSHVLEEYAGNKKNYNSEYGYLLDIMSLELRKQASILRENHYFFGDFV